MARQRSMFDEANDSVVKSECGKLVRGSCLLSVYNAHTTAGDAWRAPTRYKCNRLLVSG